MCQELRRNKPICFSDYCKCDTARRELGKQWPSWIWWFDFRYVIHVDGLSCTDYDHNGKRHSWDQCIVLYISTTFNIVFQMVQTHNKNGIWRRQGCYPLGKFDFRISREFLFLFLFAAFFTLSFFVLCYFLKICVRPIMFRPLLFPNKQSIIEIFYTYLHIMFVISLKSILKHWVFFWTHFAVQETNRLKLHNYWNEDGSAFDYWMNEIVLKYAMNFQAEFLFSNDCRMLFNIYIWYLSIL